MLIFLYIASNRKSNFSSGVTFFENITAHLNFHESVEILYISSGGMRFSVNDIEYTLSKGDFIVIFPFEVHKTIELLSYTNMYCISIDYSMINMHSKVLDEYSIVDRVIKADDLSEYTKKIFSLLIEPKTLSNRKIKTSLTTALFFELISYCKLVKKVHLEKSMFDTIIHLCINNYKDSAFNAEVLAEMSGFSSRTISRFFKKVFNMSFSRFVSTLRLKSAINLMLNGNNITESAIESGFGSIRTFNRIFKNEYSCSPREYFNLSQND